ncbi:choice-of-anchor M domain-containing protein [Nocardioides sp. CPCC 205120]|uniref:choice-of-anchor M domain-containing protein n=1 Tax=Nocardioides sp. CPCC 205120 TaxID=3406462 RepID=UPI003B50CB13
MTATGPRRPHPRPSRRGRPARAALAALTALVPLLLVAGPGASPPAGAAEPTDDPGGLDQTVEADQPVVRGERVLTSGHVDMGPKLVDGEWTFLVHDDVARGEAGGQSVWRHPDETVLHILDEGRLSVPEDPAYAFLGAEPGADVWVMPQTQDPDVVWVGWNTQDPGVMESIDRGVTLSLTGVQGPGTATVYLQSGSFGEPQVLWDSRVSEPQPVWVDVNTHTHANWVFTEPGVYLLQLTAEADLVDGTTVSDTQVVRFAVGTATSPQDALAATWEGGDRGAAGAGAGGDVVAQPADGTAPAASGEDAAADGGRDTLTVVLVVAIAAVGLALVAGVVVALVRGRRERDRVLRGGPREDEEVRA